jgi:hypothetical protein
MKDKNTDTGNLDQDLIMDTGLNQLSASEDGTNLNQLSASEDGTNLNQLSASEAGTNLNQLSASEDGTNLNQLSASEDITNRENGKGVLHKFATLCWIRRVEEWEWP